MKKEKIELNNEKVQGNFVLLLRTTSADVSKHAANLTLGSAQSDI